MIKTSKLYKGYMKPDKSTTDYKSYIYLLFLLGIAFIICVIAIRGIEGRGLSSRLEIAIKSAEEAYNTGILPRTAFYPPFMTLFILLLKTFGFVTINAFYVNTFFLMLGIVAMFFLARLLLTSNLLAFLAVLIGILNPYFIWTALLSQDTSGEFAFLVVFLLLTLKVLKSENNIENGKATVLGISIVLSATFLLLTRVTGFFMVITAFILAFFLAQNALKRRFFIHCGIGFIVVSILFCFYNGVTAGSYSLSTNSGINIYIGNHPVYLHGHPHYDIDIFIRNLDDDVDEYFSRIKQDGLEISEEAERNRAYTQQAFGFIRADIPSFLYRVIVKSKWHWLNIEKIPNYTSGVEIWHYDDNSFLFQLSKIDIFPSLGYSVYKLLYLPLFLWSITAIFRKTIDRRFTILFAPLTGLWFVVIMTFPDTRFKISAEVVVMPALIAVVCTLWRRDRSGNHLSGKVSG